MIKRWNILFTFPKLSAAHAQQFATVEAPNLGGAIKKAFDQVKKKQGVKGARIREGKISFSVEESDS